jgi:CDGSH-type Zn-finger protein
MIIEVMEDGPHMVSGGMPLGEQAIVTNAGGQSLEYKGGKHYPVQPQYALCRCGQPTNKSFCDGSHVA